MRHYSSVECEKAEATIERLEDECQEQAAYAADYHDRLKEAEVNRQAALEALNRANESLVQMTEYAGRLSMVLKAAQEVSLTVRIAPKTLLGVPVGQVVVVDHDKMNALQVAVAQALEAPARRLGPGGGE